MNARKWRGLALAALAAAGIASGAGILPVIAIAYARRGGAR